MQQFTAEEYLKIDIANSYGLDKETWDKRLSWFDEHAQCLMSMLPTAATPAMYFAGVTAWNDVKAGKPIGYPISLDGCASGFQCLSVLTGDRSAASLCGVVNRLDEHGVPVRMDAYTFIYNDLLTLLGEDSRISREDTKTAIMTSIYGSTAEPKRVFGTGVRLAAFHHVMNNQAPAVWELNEAFLSLWDENASEYNWVMPDNFHVRIQVKNAVTDSVLFMNRPYDIVRKVIGPKKTGRSLGANATHSVDSLIAREMIRRCDYNVEQVSEVQRLLFNVTPQPMEIEDTENARMTVTLWDLYEKTGYLSARILDYIDEDTVHLVERADVVALIGSLPKNPFKTLSIHDCYRCLPKYGNDLRWQYNNQLYLLAKSDLLSHLLSSITGHTLRVGKLDPTMAESILEADYALS